MESLESFKDSMESPCDSAVFKSGMSLWIASGVALAMTVRANLSCETF